MSARTTRRARRRLAPDVPKEFIDAVKRAGGEARRTYRRVVGDRLFQVAAVAGDVYPLDTILEAVRVLRRHDAPHFQSTRFYADDDPVPVWVPLRRGLARASWLLPGPVLR